MLTCLTCRLLRYHARRYEIFTRLHTRYMSGNGFHKILNDAERFVGYPTRHSSLKMLFEEEPSNIFGFAKKLVGSGHPILATVRDLLSETPYTSHYLGGMWVLLLSRAVANRNSQLLIGDFVEGIHTNQRILAETTDFIYTAFLFHRSMLDPNDKDYLTDVNKNTIELGNNLCVLGGDLLLAKASLALAKLNNTEIVELMGLSIGHLAEGSLLQTIDNECYSVEDWENSSFLMQGSLLAHSCKSTFMITGQSHDIQEKAFKFGRNVDLLQKCHKDLESYQSKKYPLSRNNILLFLALNSSEKLRESYKQYTNHERSFSLSKELRHDIELTVPDLMEQFQFLCKKYLSSCQCFVEEFENKTAVNIINNILEKICDS